MRKICSAVTAFSASLLISLAGSVTSHTTAAHAATASSTHVTRKQTAFNWARAQAGKPYIYGGTGPRGFDCSGLVYEAYRHAGISLPRTADAQRSSSKTYRISKSRAEDGDLIFWGYGHVELVYRYHGTIYRYGAHHSGTRISREPLYGSPAFYHFRGAG